MGEKSECCGDKGGKDNTEICEIKKPASTCESTKPVTACETEKPVSSCGSTSKNLGSKSGCC